MRRALQGGAAYPVQGRPSAAPSWRVREPTAEGSCRARAARGGKPCQIEVWYVGTHEALFKEVRTMWSRFPEEYSFSYKRVNSQGIYSPADLAKKGKASSHPRNKQGLRWHVTSEADIDTSELVQRFHNMLKGKAVAEADLFLCTIPSVVCSVLLGQADQFSQGVVLYTANPATAQVPFSQQRAWLKLLSGLAADPKNQLV
ncbi:unnamed protein product, partial [Polarella glacialis]